MSSKIDAFFVVFRFFSTLHCLKIIWYLLFTQIPSFFHYEIGFESKTSIHFFTKKHTFDIVHMMYCFGYVQIIDVFPTQKHFLHALESGK